MKNFTFKKSEKLVKKKKIKWLFNKNKKVEIEGLQLLWNFVEENEIKQQEFPAKILITIPKKLVKKAVLRNRLKRKIGECYRVNNKQNFYDFLDEKNIKISFVVIYKTTLILDYWQIKIILNKLIEELIESIEQHIR